MSVVEAPSPGEMGYVVANPEAGYRAIDREDAFELKWPECLKTYDLMRRQDAQVRTVLKAVTLPILATPWRLDPAGADPEVVDEIGEQLGLPIVGSEGEAAKPRRLRRFSWPEHLRMALLSLPFGSMFFEQVVEFDPATRRYRLRKLAPRMPATLADIKVARDGGLEAIEQRPPGGLQVFRASDAGRIVIPVDRLVAYVHEREGSNWGGESILRAAYKNWMLKDRLLKLEAMTIERNGMGVPIVINPEGASPEQIEKARKMANSYRAGDASGASLPFGSKFSLEGVTGQLPDPRPAIDYHDAQIGRVALAHFLNLDGQGGSYALASTQADLFATAVKSVAEMVRDAANRYIVEDLVDWNFGETVAAPQIVFDEIGESSLSVANALRTLVDAGVIIPDRSLEEQVRRWLDLPAKDFPPKEAG
ncbi:phage portal protein family protein [Prescottella equi]